ncbi:MAG: AAA family ATPase [Aeromonas veronii]
MHQLFNFKSFREARVNLFPDLTILIGKNGGGKSNIIEGIELLAALAGGTPIYELAEKPGVDSYNIVRGGIHACPSFGETAFSLAFSGIIKFLGKQEKFEYKITVSTENMPCIIGEHLKVGRRTFFSAAQENGSEFINVTFDNFAKGGVKPQRKMFGDRSIISRYNELINNSEKGDSTKKLSAISVVTGILRYLDSSFIFDPNPKMMRDYVRVGQGQLNKHASNISAVLYGLHKSELAAHKDALSRILNIVKQVPEEPFGAFDFTVTSQGDVLFGFVMTSKEANKSNIKNQIIDARLISDGTLRAIAVITALETIREGSRVVIEEFDNGLHPSRANLILDSIVEVVTRRKLNVLLTTHNPATLDAIDNNILKDVVVCYWSEVTKSSEIKKLLDIPKIDSLLESKDGLGDLVTKSLFESHLAPQFPDAKKNKALALIRGLK